MTPLAVDVDREGDAATDRLQLIPVAVDAPRLADHDRACLYGTALGEQPRPELRPVLLVGGEHERQPAGGRGIVRQRGGQQHRRHGAFHVAGAEPVEVTVVDPGDERVARPRRAADRLGVEMSAEREVASARAEVEVDDEVGTGRVCGDDAALGRSSSAHVSVTTPAAARSSPGGLGLGAAISRSVSSTTSGHLLMSAASVAVARRPVDALPRPRPHGPQPEQPAFLTEVGSRYFGPFGPR